MEKTIWFDVTVLYNWNRPPVGIVRVQMECARNLLAEFGKYTRFCRYDGIKDAYIEVPHSEVAAFLRRLDGDSDWPWPRFPKGFVWILKYLAKKVVHTLPKRLQSKTNRRLGQWWGAIRGLRQRMVRLLHRTRNHKVPYPGGIEPELRRGDVYITLGLDFESVIFPGMSYIKERTGIKVVGMCYDVIPIKLPHLSILQGSSHKFSGYIINMAGCADTVLCDSQNTRRDLYHFLSTVNGYCPPLGVITLGADIRVKGGAVGRQVREICRKPYILYVSTIERRKNHEILYRVYTRFVEAGRRNLPKLVFVGAPGWGVEDFLSDLRLDRSVEGLILMLHDVTDSELSYLYRHALFTVYPSLYEGWGLPVAESLAHGKFCIASSTSSLPEVGGDFVEYLDPWDLPAWVERIAYYFDHVEALRAREERIRSHYKPRTWKETTRSLVDRALSL